MDRPTFCTDEHLRYLDTLRSSGATNMFGAATWLADAFGMDKKQAREVLAYWMETFPRTEAA